MDHEAFAVWEERATTADLIALIEDRRLPVRDRVGLVSYMRSSDEGLQREMPVLLASARDDVAAVAAVLLSDRSDGPDVVPILIGALERGHDVAGALRWPRRPFTHEEADRLLALLDATTDRSRAQELANVLSQRERGLTPQQEQRGAAALEKLATTIDDESKAARLRSDAEHWRNGHVVDAGSCCCATRSSTEEQCGPPTKLQAAAKLVHESTWIVDEDASR